MLITIHLHQLSLAILVFFSLFLLYLFHSNIDQTVVCLLYIKKFQFKKKPIESNQVKMSSEDVFQRLFQKDTVNSVARRVCDQIHADSLDFVLSSVYNHVSDLFVSKFDTILQLDNAKHNPIKENLFNKIIQNEKNNIHHPLVIGKLE